jgi:uncharacterized protein
MVTIPDEVVNKVKFFAESISQDIHVQKIYLFGSYASGKANSDSDIDILVISDDFKKMTSLNIGSLLFRKAAKIPGDLQPIGYTYEEVQNNNNWFLQEILSNSVEIPLH